VSEPLEGQQEEAQIVVLDAMSHPAMPRIGAEPPREFRVFRWGLNKTTKGDLYLTPEGAARVMAAYIKHGVVQTLDYHHATFDPAARPQDKKSAGQYRLELRGKPGDESGGLWLVDIQYTPPAEQAIRDGEWPYFSPAVAHDAKGVIVEYKNTGLVANPGTISATPLILSAEGKPMADSKRLARQAMRHLEAGSKKLTEMREGEADGSEVRQLSDEGLGLLGGYMDKLRCHAGLEAYDDDDSDEMTAKKLSDAAAKVKKADDDADAAKKGEAEAKSKADKKQIQLDAILSALGITDADKAPDEIKAKLALLSASSERERKAVRALVDANAMRLPATQIPSLKDGPLEVVLTTLSALPSNTLPTAAVAETPPAAVTLTPEDSKNMANPTEQQKMLLHAFRATLKASSPDMTEAQLQDEAMKMLSEDGGISTDAQSMLLDAQPFRRDPNLPRNKFGELDVTTLSADGRPRGEEFLTLASHSPIRVGG